LEQPGIWNDAERAQDLGRERAKLEQVVEGLNGLTRALSDAAELLELAAAESDTATADGIERDLAALGREVDQLEFQRMFPGKMDSHSAYLDIQAGAGGTEAQDWAAMLLRMYLKWADGHGIKTEIIDQSDGEVAGIKGATISMEGKYAYGWLRTETGVHRLVRKSPFDSGNRRHTSFASVFVSPEVDDDIDIEINAAAKVLEDSKSDVSWGHQIRSYVLDQSRIKDLRTGVEIGNTTAVLDGALDVFMQASLKQGL
jgi:peptide chain release factor 2